MNKKIIAALALLIILAAIPVAIYLVRKRQEIRKMAAPASVLSLVPASLDASPAEEFSLDVNIDTGENLAVGVDVTLNFDASKLTVTKVERGTFFSQTLVAGDISSGSVRFAYYEQPAKKGSGVVATIGFKVSSTAQPGPIQVSFSPATIVSGVGEKGSILAGANSAQVTILALTLPTPTPTPLLTSTPNEITPTPTTAAGGSSPTPTPTTPPGTGGLVPTPTPTPTASAASGTGGSSLPTATPTPIQELPVTGTLSPTLLLLTVGSLLVFVFLFAF